MLLRSKYRKYFFILLFLVALSFTCFIFQDISLNNLSEINSSDSDFLVTPPQKQAFDYEPVISESIHGKGNMTIIDMLFTEQGFIFRTGYEDIIEDRTAKNLIPRDYKLTFIKTLVHANFDILDTRENNEIMKVRFNDSITFDYNENASGRLMYKSNLQPATLIEVYLNGTLLPEANYTIDEEDAFVYYYRNQHNNDNGTLHFSFIYDDYSVVISEWGINQFAGQNLYMTDITQDLSVRYNYGFKIHAYEQAGQAFSFADNLSLTFLFSIQDSEKLSSFQYAINGTAKTVDDHKNSKNWFNGSCLANQTEISLNFSAAFTVKFNDVCHDFWAVDRLVWMKNIRERIYFLSIVDGPSLNIQDIQFNELNIYSGQYLNVRSNFERTTTVYNLNLTGGGGLDKTPGLKISAPYFIKNEVLAVIVEYFTNDSLSIIVTDQVLNPVEGVYLKFYYFNQTYGTYISAIKSQPIPEKFTDFAGEVTLENIPRGLYRVDVYNSLNQFIINGTVDTSISINYINTPIPHIPTTILFFSVLYSIILVIGIWIYLKNKNVE